MPRYARLRIITLVIAIFFGSTASGDAQNAAFQICGHPSGEDAGPAGKGRCVQSTLDQGAEVAEFQLGGNSFHWITVEFIGRRDVQFVLKCTYGDTRSAPNPGDVPGNSEDASQSEGSCPQLKNQTYSAHVKRLSLEIVGEYHNIFLRYQCWTSRFEDSTKIDRGSKIVDHTATPACGTSDPNAWISGIKVYTISYPHF